MTNLISFAHPGPSSPRSPTRAWYPLVHLLYMHLTSKLTTPLGHSIPILAHWGSVIQVPTVHTLPVSPLLTICQSSRFQGLVPPHAQYLTYEASPGVSCTCVPLTIQLTDRPMLPPVCASMQLSVWGYIFGLVNMALIFISIFLIAVSMSPPMIFFCFGVGKLYVVRLYRSVRSIITQQCIVWYDWIKSKISLVNEPEINKMSNGPHERTEIKRGCAVWEWCLLKLSCHLHTLYESLCR